MHLLIAVTVCALAYGARAQSPCSQSTKLTPSVTGTRFFGGAVDVDGDRVAIGAPYGGADVGRAFVYERDPDGWAPLQAFTTPGSDPTTDFGQAVALEDDVLFIGSPDELSGGIYGGIVYVYRDVAGSYGLETQLVATDAADQDQFGASLALDGTRIAIGAPVDQTPNGIGSGSVYVFEKKPAGWKQGPKLVPSDGTPLSRFGRSLALRGDTLIVGAPYDHHSGLVDPGSVYVYEFDGTKWNEAQKLLAPMPGSDDEFGIAVGLDGDLLAVAARVQMPGGNSGGAHLFRSLGGSWSFEDTVLGLDGYQFTRAVAVAGERVVLGSLGGGDLVPVYALLGGSWTVELTFSSNLIDDFGNSVAIEGSRVVIGANFDDEAGFNAGAVYVEDLVPEPATYCTAKTTAFGCLPVVDAAGTPSASGVGPFPITAREVPNQKPGLLFYGRSGKTALPFLGGTLCVLPPLVRTTVQFSGGNPPPSDCSGAFAIDFSTLAPGDPNLVAGSSVHAQYWFRDPTHPDGTGAGLSDAVAFELCD